MPEGEPYVPPDSHPFQLGQELALVQAQAILARQPPWLQQQLTFRLWLT